MNTSSIAAPAIRRIIPSQAGSRENPYITQISVRLYWIAPPRSKDSPFESAHSPLRYREMSIREKIPSGTLMRKMLRHPKCWVRNPPMNGPRERPV